MSNFGIAPDGSWAVAADYAWDNPPFEQSGYHPVIGVTWKDAVAFCEWLTLEEKKLGLLRQSVQYRLPTSPEWSLAARVLATGNAKLVFAWGTLWPPISLSGNYSPQISMGTAYGPVVYDDGYFFTSPVGVFRAKTPFPDLGGNVREWCQTEDPSRERRVIRGGAWDLLVPKNESMKNVMRLDHEAYEKPDARWSNLGFRVLLDLGT